ncbi:CARDB domain-containing protein [Chloroflexota bacterium]
MGWKKVSAFVALLVALSLLLPGVTLAQLPPALPALYEGTVTTIGGDDAPDGAVVSARVADWETPAAAKAVVSGGEYELLKVYPSANYRGLEVEFFVDVDGDGPALAVPASPDWQVSFQPDTWSGSEIPLVHLTYTPPVLLEEIIIEPETTELTEVGATQLFVATAYYTDGSTRDVTAEVEWKSSDMGVAVMRDQALAVAVGYGNSTITAEMDTVVSNNVLLILSKPQPTPTPTPLPPTPTPTPKPAVFIVSNIRIDRTEAKIGEEVDISASVTNIGEATGSHDVALMVNSIVDQTKNVMLASGEVATVSFTFTTDDAATYNIAVGNNQAGSVKIVKPLNIWVIIGPTIGVVLAAILGAVYFLVRRRMSRRIGEPKNKKKKNKWWAIS